MKTKKISIKLEESQFFHLKAMLFVECYNRQSELEKARSLMHSYKEQGLDDTQIDAFISLVKQRRDFADKLYELFELAWLKL